jgi:XRE family transcriptional regulator, regulator of sulfur utilization
VARIATVSESKVFGRNMRAERKRQGLTQEEVGHTADLDRTEISRLERGKREPRLGTIVKVARALEIPAGQLLDGLPARSA